MLLAGGVLSLLLQWLNSQFDVIDSLLWTGEYTAVNCEHIVLVYKLLVLIDKVGTYLNLFKYEWCLDIV